MIRLLIALLIVALLVSAISRMYGPQRTVSPASGAETEQGQPLDPYARAQQFSEDWDQSLDEQREALDKQIDDG